MQSIQDLQIARSKLIRDFKDNQFLAKQELKSKLAAIDLQIKGKSKNFANIQSKTVKNILNKIR